MHDDGSGASGAAAGDDAVSNELAASTVAIVGVGLLGGSLGLALAGKVGWRIGVVAPGDVAAAAHALARGVVDEVAVLDEAVPAADIVVLATPVGTIIELVTPVARLARAGALVTDLGSTKLEVVDAMTTAGGAAHFVGGHPMCGGTGGLADARADLFEGALWVFCPTPNTPVTGLLHALVQATGAARRTLELDAHQHDVAAAMASHAPYALAQLLVHAHARESPSGEAARALAGRGWRGATRLAKGDVTMWHDILVTNRRNVAAELRELAAGLNSVASIIERSDDPDTAAELGAWLTEGRALRRT